MYPHHLNGLFVAGANDSRTSAVFERVQVQNLSIPTRFCERRYTALFHQVNLEVLLPPTRISSLTEVGARCAIYARTSTEAPMYLNSA